MIIQNKFIKKLNVALKPFGGRLYYVGGIVRDDILKIVTKDIDVVVTGINRETFEKVLSTHCTVQLVGKSFGVYKCFKDGQEIDIAFPRKEISIGDLHNDFQVDFGPQITLEEDLQRRDFTINAMARDVETGELVDPYGGVNDLNNRTLRQLSDNSIKEDYLRALRALQFVSRFGFEIEAETLVNMKKYEYLFSTISSERVTVELNKFFRGTNLIKAVKYCKGCNLLEPLFRNVTDQQLAILEEINKKESYDELIIYVVFFSFFEDHNEIKDILKIEKGIYKRIKSILSIINKKNASSEDIKLLLNLLGLDDYKRSIIVKKYLNITSDGEVEVLMLEKIVRENQPYLLQHLAVNGDDLIALGFSGAKVGFILKKMLLDVIKDQAKNNRDYLLTNFCSYT